MPALNAYSGGGFRAKMKRKGETAFELIPGLNSYSETGGDAARRTIQAFEGSSQVQGKMTPPTISGTVGAISPVHPVHLDLRKAAVEGETREFRFELNEDRVFTPAVANTVAIANDGVCTFAAGLTALDPELVAPGMAIKTPLTGSPKYYVLVSVKGYEGASDTVAFLLATGADPVATALTPAAKPYAIVQAPLAREFSSYVALANRPSVDAEGEVSGTFSLTPTVDPIWRLA